MDHPSKIRVRYWLKVDHFAHVSPGVNVRRPWNVSLVDGNELGERARDCGQRTIAL